MDPRVHEHASIIVDHSTSVEKGDNVLIRGSAETAELIVALFEKLGEKGAFPMVAGGSGRATRAYMRAMDPADFELPDHQMAAVENADVVISILGSANVNETGDVPPEKNAAKSKVMKPIQDEYMKKRWCATQHPAPGNAQKAELSTAAYADFVYSAVNKDWEAQREYQQQMVEILDPASEVRIVSGETTDLWMSVEGNKTINDYAEHNLPGGEVFTAPIPSSVEGEVLFDMPLVAQGREVQDVWLRFEEGRVVDHSAAKNEEVLTAMLETDEGARYLGELGIGMNRDIDRFTYNMLFDEKMGDTVHLAIGRAYGETVGEGNEVNESVVHTDMIVDMSEESFIEVDGEVVQEDGTFVFEE